MQKFLNVALFTLCLFAGLSGFSAVKVEYKISRTHGLFNFVQAIGGDINQAPGLREIFDKSSYNKSDLQHMLTVYKGLDVYLNRTNLPGNDSPITGRYPGRPLKDTLLTQSIFAKDLADFSQRALGILPMKQHEDFFLVLKKFEPAYLELVWNKSLPDLQRHKAELEKMATEANLDALFAKAVVFYRATWPGDVPFTVGLYPVPFIEGFKNSSNSHSVGTVEDHGVMISPLQRDLVGSFSVIFHEICHSLYDSQDPAFMKSLSTYFIESPSPYRDSAYKWFNEAAATAIGNGWVFATVMKRPKLVSWYNDPIIDGFAKEIYPLTEAYITQGKSLDRAYVDQAVLLFAKKFPESIYLYKDQLNHLTFIHEGSVLKSSEARDYFVSRFAIAGFAGSAPIDHPITIQTASVDRNTLFLLINNAEGKQLERLAAGVPFLKRNFLTLLSLKNRSFFAAIDENSRTYVVVKAENKQEFIAALDKMKLQLRIDPKAPVQSF
jgi:hypothetical protein